MNNLQVGWVGSHQHSLFIWVWNIATFSANDTGCVYRITTKVCHLPFKFHKLIVLITTPYLIDGAFNTERRRLLPTLVSVCFFVWGTTAHQHSKAIVAKNWSELLSKERDS